MTTATNSGKRLKPWQALVGFLAACYAVSAIGTLSTIASIPTWYAALNKPSFNPPNWIFGPVWTILYTLMAIAAWLVWRTPGSRRRTAALWLFAIQLVLNFLWTPVFFHFHAIAAALAIIVLLWLAILVTTMRFWPLSRSAGWMMLPYLAWVGFAAALNFEMLRLNAVPLK
jgi:tryptophan-rich sensory protein